MQVYPKLLGNQHGMDLK